jgi:hypothetical protein
LCSQLFKPRKPTYKRLIWKYDNGDYDSYRHKLANADWTSLLSDDDPNSYADHLTKAILDVALTSIPNKLVTIRPSDPPWMHSNIRKLIRQRKRLHRRAKTTQNEYHWSKFRAKRNEVISSIRKAQKQYFNKLSAKIQNVHSDSKSWWKLVKQLLNNNSPQIEANQSLTVNGKLIYDDNEKANAFKKYFIAQTKIDDTNVSLPRFTSLCDRSFDQIDVTPAEVTEILASLDITKSCSPDLINPRLLYEAANELGIPIAKIIACSFDKGIFPTSWKMANVTPIHKKR